MESGNYELNTYFSYEHGGKVAQSKQDELLKSLYPQIEKLFLKNGLKLDKDYGFTDGSNKSYLPQFSYQREGNKLSKVVVTYYADGFEVLGEIEIELEDGVDIKIEFPNWNIKEEGKGFMAKGGEVAKVGEPYDSMTKYQLEKEYKKLNEKRDTLKNKYGSFDSQEISENEKEIEKIITLLYGEDFSGKGQKFKYAKGGVTFADKVKSVKSSLLKRKKVSPKVQKDYGKTYSPAEAEDSAKRIVGAMTAKERLMKRMKKGKK
jgi:hypothetical protein